MSSRNVELPDLLVFGPLTREAHDMLALSYYDQSFGDRQRIAAERGITENDYLRVQFDEMDRRRERELAEIATRKAFEDIDPIDTDSASL